MRRKGSALDEIAAEHTTPAAGEFERAAGWFAIARFVAAPEGGDHGSDPAKPFRPASAPMASAGGVAD